MGLFRRTLKIKGITVIIGRLPLLFAVVVVFSVILIRRNVL